MKKKLNVSNTTYDLINSRKGQIAVLIDPEKSQDEKTLKDLLHKCEVAKVDFIFIGGSTVTRREFEFTASTIKCLTKIPLVIFPGSADQISDKADAILYLSLLSGRNPDFLIGHHIRSANELAEIGIEVIPTSYLLIDGGTASSVAYVSQTNPIPREHISIVKQTALAGKFLGKKITYLDAGSGAKYPVPVQMIHELDSVGSPIIVGGGIRAQEQIHAYANAGANVIVIGNAIEQDMNLVLDLRSHAIRNK